MRFGVAISSGSDHFGEISDPNTPLKGRDMKILIARSRTLYRNVPSVRRLEERGLRHPRHRHEPPVGDADFGDDRKRDQVEAHVRQGAAEFGPGPLKFGARRRDPGRPSLGQQPGDGQGDVREHRPAPDDDDPAPDGPPAPARATSASIFGGHESFASDLH